MTKTLGECLLKGDIAAHYFRTPAGQTYYIKSLENIKVDFSGLDGDLIIVDTRDRNFKPIRLLYHLNDVEINRDETNN